MSLAHALHGREKGQNDKNECYTPEYAVEPLIPYLKKYILVNGKSPVIWEPTDPEGTRGITTALRKAGFKVVTTGLPDVSFYDVKEPLGDIVVTNPPYSGGNKERFLKKLFEWEIPWAMLLPLTCLEGKNRGKLWQKFGVELLVFDDRVNFIKPEYPKDNLLGDKNLKQRDRSGSCWFNTSWFCSGILPEKLIFTHLEKME